MPSPKSHRPCRGFSLVETMAAALILGLSLTGILSLLGAGAATETDDGLQRQARILAANALEQPAYRYSNYDGLAPGSVSTNKVIRTSLDEPVEAILSVTVSEPAGLWLQDGNGGPAIPVNCKAVTALARWTLNGRSDSVWVAKTLSGLPP